MNCQVCFFKIIVKRHLYHVNQDHYLLSEMVRHDSVITPDKNNYYEIVAHGSIQNITITLNNILGNNSNTLINGTYKSGVYESNTSFESIPDGVYVLSMKTRSRVVSKLVVISK